MNFYHAYVEIDCAYTFLSRQLYSSAYYSINTSYLDMQNALKPHHTQPHRTQRIALTAASHSAHRTHSRIALTAASHSAASHVLAHRPNPGGESDPALRPPGRGIPVLPRYAKVLSRITLSRIALSASHSAHRTHSRIALTAASRSGHGIGGQNHLGIGPP